MTPYDAWLLRRIHVGRSVNGEVAHLSDEFKAVAGELLKLADNKRAALWKAFLKQRDDGAAIVASLAAADPDAPAPPTGALEWAGDPKPVRRELRPVPPLDPQLIPSPLRGWLVDIAERVSCPLDFPTIGAVVALATVVGRKVAIRPKRHDDWTVVPNLWGAVIGRPGVLKTTALTEAAKPLRRLEALSRDRHEEAMKMFEQTSRIAEAQAKAARKALDDAAKKGKPAEILRELARRADVGAESTAPTLKRYTTSDASVERLGELLRDNSNGIGQIRDELTGWFRSFEKAGRECDRAFYLEAWNGNGPPFTFDRIGRGMTLIPSPCVSILGGMQPGPLRAFLRGVAKGETEDDGLISRFQLLTWPDTAPSWRNVDRWPDTSEKNRAFAIFQALDELDPSCLPVGTRREGDDETLPFLNFEPDAQHCFDAWRETLEAKLRTPDENPMVESHLAKYRSLMPSLALLFHLVEVVDGAGHTPVTLRAAQLAAAWCDYLEAHARRVYGCVADPEIDSAMTLAERIKAGSLPSPFALRHVYRRCWTNLDTPDDVRRAVAVLEDLGWLQAVETPETGGAPRMDIHLHPSLPRKVETKPAEIACGAN